MRCRSISSSVTRLQTTGSPTGTGTICDPDGMTGRSALAQFALQRRGPFPVTVPQAVVRLEMADGRQRAGGHGGRQRRREDETRRAGSHEVDQGSRSRDIAADHAERLGERSLNHRHAVRDAVARRDARSPRPVHSDRMHLVEIGHRAMLVREVADRRDRRHVAVHRIDRFERDHLGTVRTDRRQLALQVVKVVMGEDDLLRHAVANAGDHRRMVVGVGDENAAGQLRAERRQNGLVRHVAGREEQSRLRPVKIRELRFQQNVIVGRAGNVARSAGAGAGPVDRLLHRRPDGRVLPHAEIVVGAPYRDVAAAGFRTADRARIGADRSLEVGENPVPAFRLETGDALGEKTFVVHSAESRGRRATSRPSARIM